MPGHTPVLLDEVLHFLDPHPGGSFIDATLGAGGHSRAILERTAPGGRVLAVDQDESALESAKATLASFGSRVEFVHSNFRDVAAIAGRHGFLQADGVLADIGLSSMMIDDPSRGFSFMREGPLDMRMNRSQGLTAADVVNTCRENEIADILYKFGEERRSRKIARSIVRARPLFLTTDLARAVERVLGGPRYGRIHPATRTFQALRIYVNDELGSLESFLDSAMTVVRSGGRLVVISFHSLEDRIVKNRFRASAISGSALTRKVVTAGDEEVSRNPRGSKRETSRVGERLMSIEIQFDKRIVNRVVREADSKSHRDYLIVTVLAGMFLLGLFTYGWQHYRWIQYGYRLEEVQKKKEQLAETGRQLRLERASLRSLQRIDWIARNELGMVVPAAGQAVILSGDSPWTIPAPQTKPGGEPAEMAAKH